MTTEGTYDDEGWREGLLGYAARLTVREGVVGSRDANSRKAHVACEVRTQP